MHLCIILAYAGRLFIAIDCENRSHVYNMHHSIRCCDGMKYAPNMKYQANELAQQYPKQVYWR